jgi:hypothetical protein
MPRLLVNPGTPQQWEIQLKPGVNSLGRSPACDAQVDHTSVSGTHCHVIVNGGSVTVKDLGSTNGTFLNRAPVQEAGLSAGQHLQLGGVDMEFVDEPPRTSAAPVVVRLAASAPTGVASARTADGPPHSSPISAAPRIALKVAAHESAPTPPPSHGAVVADEYAEQPVDGPRMCKYHPKSPARYLCLQCQLNFCEMCVTSRPTGDRTGMFCRRCSNECVALQVHLVREGADKENFFANVPKAFAYPFKGSGLTFLIIGTIFFALVDFLGTYSFYLRVIYIGYTFAYVQRVIQTAAQGSDESAGWPDVSEFWSDIIVPFFQSIGLFLICFGPAIGLGFWVGWEALTDGSLDPQKLILIGAAVVLGGIYFPMAFLALAMFDSVVSANPLVVVPAITRVPLEYLAVLVVTGIIFVVRIVQGALVELLGVPVVPLLITAGVGLYFLTVQGRMLGLMYFAKRHKLGWFSR